jgi:hypothetical protein
MNEDKYGIIWDDTPLTEDGDDAPELVVDEPAGDEEPEEAAPVEPVLDEPAPESPGITYTRGPNGRLIPS